MSFQISAAAFESIIRSLRSDKQVGRGSDKRKTPRVGLSGRVTIIPCSPHSNKNPVVAMVRDLSTTGAKFMRDVEIAMPTASPQAGTKSKSPKHDPPNRRA